MRAPRGSPNGREPRPLPERGCGVAQLTSFHDAELRKATKEINAILDGVKKSNGDDSRELCLIQIKDRHFLVWAHEGLVGPHDEDETIRKMLRLKAK